MLWLENSGVVGFIAIDKENTMIICNYWIIMNFRKWFLKRYKVLKGVQRKDKILPAGGEVGRFNIVKMSINEYI